MLHTFLHTPLHTFNTSYTSYHTIITYPTPNLPSPKLTLPYLQSVHVHIRVPATAFASLAIGSPIPTPQVAKGAALKANKGTTPTPRNLKTLGGAASVTTGQSAMKQRGVIAEAREAVKKLAEEQQNGYFEVFRRLITVPTSTFAEVEGDRGLDHSSQSKIKFDKGAAYKKLRHLLPLQVTPLPSFAKYATL